MLKTFKMEENNTSCIKRVGGTKICSFCGNILIKHGKSSSNTPRYRCKICKKTQVENYTYKAYSSSINKDITHLIKEGVGIRSSARLLCISATTVLSRIIKIGKDITQPVISKRQSYQVDEMRTFIKRKDNLVWIVYAISSTTKKVVSFSVGKRTNATLKKVIKSLEISQAKKIYTDKLKNYKTLINSSIHSLKYRGTNHIERKNLTLRTHLKRLNRKTICFSRSAFVLTSILKIYFWG